MFIYGKGAQKVRGKLEEKAPLSDLQVRILDMVWANPEATYDDMQEKLGKNRTTIMRNIQQLKEIGILKRIGSKKTGSWEITE